MVPPRILLAHSIQTERLGLSLSRQVQPIFNANQEHSFLNLKLPMPYTCPVCGLPGLTEIPRTEKGAGSYEICPSCGFQFGVSDDNRGFTYEQWRERWIKHGMPWDKGRTKPPPGWDPQEQLRNIGR